MRDPGPVKVVSISLDERLRAVSVDDRYVGVLFVVLSHGTVVGTIRLPGLRTFPADLLRRLVAQRCADALWRLQLARTFEAAARGIDKPAERRAPSVSVVVCTRNRPDQLQLCLESLLALATEPLEILVVDNAPSDDRTREVCEALPVRYVLEPLPGQSRARNRGILETTGELVAFTDDDCVVDPHWLDGLAEPFDDTLLAAVTGYVAPLELETPAQIMFEQHGGFDRGLERQVFDGARVSPVRVAGRVGAGANMILRRSALSRAGLFAEDLGPGTRARAADETDLFYRLLAEGGRVAFDPSRLVWHRHRRDLPALRRIVFEYGVAVTAFALRSLARYREPAALRVLVWWWAVHLRRQLAAILLRRPGRMPFRVFLAELGGSLAGPWELYRSRRSRRGIAPLELPAAAAAPVPRITVSPGAPPLSVVIPSHDRRERLVEVLDALARQTYPADRFEAVVVLDACSDGSAEHVRALSLPYRLQLVEHDARNAATTRNRAVREAGNPIVVMLDDDVVPDADALAAHAEAHRLALDRHAALGYCPPFLEGRSPWELSLRAWWEDHYRRRGEHGHRWTFSDFASANASLARDTLLAHPYDEEFPTRREDWELGLRLLEAGVRFAPCPGARALHYLDTTFPTALEHRRADGRADALFAEKHPHARSRLPVASFLWSVDDDWLHERTRLAALDPERYERRVHAQLPMLDVFARARLRGQWRKRAGRLQRAMYVLGLVEALGSAEKVNMFAAAIFDSVETLHVSLDRPTSTGVADSPGAVELDIAAAGAVVGRVTALDPGTQWEWEVVTERVVAGLGDDIRTALVSEALRSPLEAEPPDDLPPLLELREGLRT
jgi:glycosyltransferase involved in cell wall biosynthesis